MWINGQEGMTVRFVTHLGHYLDGSRYAASHRGRDCVSIMYLPKLVMNRDSTRFRNIDGEIEIQVTEPDEEFQINKEVRQGSVLFPSLFNLHTEKISREAEEMNRVNVGGVNISNLRYAYDTVFLAGNNTDLQELGAAIENKGKRYGMEMNMTKTK